MSSFFQTNPLCAEKLYKKVIEYCNKVNNNSGIILDLFCGTGTISQMVAINKKNTRVIGVDIAESAIKNAIESAKKNKIKR